MPIRARSRSNTQQNVRSIKAMRVALVVGTGATAATPADRRGCQRGALIGGQLVAGCYEFNSRFVNICAEFRGEARARYSTRRRDSACASHYARAGRSRTGRIGCKDVTHGRNKFCDRYWICRRVLAAFHRAIPICNLPGARGFH